MVRERGNEKAIPKRDWAIRSKCCSRKKDKQKRDQEKKNVGLLGQTFLFL